MSYIAKPGTHDLTNFVSISGLTVVKKRDFTMERPPTKCTGAKPCMRRCGPKVDGLLGMVRAFFWRPTCFCSPKGSAKT